jgi:ADP-ribose pyrophosphatase YjhB (NUDIX family)
MGKERQQGGFDFGVRVAAVIERDGSLLLVRHQKPEREPYWVLPGGRLEPGESIPECGEREVMEETGLRARFAGVLYVSEFMREGRHTVDVTARMAVESGEARLGADPEVAPGAAPTLGGLRWVEMGELRKVDLLPARIKERILRDAQDGWPLREVYLGGDRY